MARRAGEIGERIYSIRYRHAQDGKDYQHDFGRGATLRALPSGDVLIENDRGPSWENDEGQRFLINPGGRMAARRRNAKGRFVKGGGKKTRRRTRRTTARRPAAKRTRRRRRRASVSTASSSPRRRRRRSYKRNPRFSVKSMMRAVQDGVVGGAEVVIGKAAARAVPDMFNLPKQGNIGLAIQAGIGLGIAIIGDALRLPRDHVAMLAAGAFSAPLETLAVAHNIPIIGDALHPVSAAADVRGYLSAGYNPGGGVGRYIPPMNGGAGRRVASGGQSTTPMMA